ncbi:hypothetical protein MRX96_000262 [Rhipicephalus microplus]
MLGEHRSHNSSSLMLKQVATTAIRYAGAWELSALPGSTRSANTYSLYSQAKDGPLMRHVSSLETQSVESSFCVFIPRKLHKTLLTYFYDPRLTGHSDGKRTVEKLCSVATRPHIRNDVMIRLHLLYLPDCKIKGT